MSATSGLAEFHEELRLVARDLLGKATDDRVWSDIVDAGWAGLEVAEALGGSGATFAETAVVLEEMGRAATAGPYLGTAVLGAGALGMLTPNDACDVLAGAVAEGRTRLAVALTPGGDQLDAAPPFHIRRDGSVRLVGAAEFVVDGPAADRLLLLAHDDDRDDRMVLVSVDPSSVEVSDQPVLDATRRFGVVVARDTQIDEASIWTFEGDATFVARRLVDRAALAIACDSLGLAAAMLDATVSYVGVRRQFDRPIGSFQAVKHACADMFVGVTVARELLVAAIDAIVATADTDAADVHGETDGEHTSAAVSRAKSHVCSTTVEVVGKAMQLHGGIGYTWESGIHTYLKRAVLNRALFGSPAAHRRRLGALIASVEK